MVLGVDIGGTFIKFGVVDEEYKIIEKRKIPTATQRGADGIIKDIIEVANSLKETYPIEMIGIGTPGTVDYKNGVCIRSANLPYKNTQMVSPIESATKLPTSLANDASCAVCGELYAGSGKKYDNLVMVTLGTGIGGGIIINGKPYFGSRGGAGDFGHIIIEKDGIPCRCGQNGCFEMYASVTALINRTREATALHPDSVLAKEGEEINGRTPFAASEKGCPVAKEVLNSYFDYLATGIKSLIRAFQPDAVVLGGAVTNEGDALLIPVRERITLPGDIFISSLKNDAGVIGAAAMAVNKL